MKKKRKPAPAKPEGKMAETPAAHLADAQAVEDAIEEIQIRIDLIGRDYADDPGLTIYRRALILAVEALRKQLPGGS